MEIPQKLQDIASKDLMAVAGYRISWHRRKTKADGCPCQKYKRKFPAGTRMWVFDGPSVGIRAVVCFGCAS